jgi:two-component system, NarL family, sensor histidine kinase UhpB
MELTVAGAPETYRARWWLRWLAIPLAWKLVGATLLVAIAVLVVLVATGRPGAAADGAVALAASLALNFLLIRLALRPLDALDAAADRVAGGDYGYRMEPSALEDRRAAVLRRTFNRLLDRIERDRVRTQQLARLSLDVRETERAAIAAQLRDATAQQLAALLLQLGAAAHANHDPQVGKSIAAARDIAGTMVGEVGDIAEAVYPGLLGELGLPAALQMLGRRAGRRTGLDVNVDIASDVPSLPLPVVRALYRVASEAVANAGQHARARTLAITLHRQAGAVVLDVRDDGKGFDVAEAEQSTAGVGLFGARELVAHVGGVLRVASAERRGTLVSASVPLTAEGRA